MTLSTILPPKKRKILVISVDFDGCIFNSLFANSDSPNRLIEANESFIEHVLKQIETGEYDEVIFMVGSNRQSKSIDDTNRRTWGSCYPAILKLCDEIKRRTKTPCKVDRFLLSDVYGDRPSGENFTKALNGEKYNYSDFVWDEDKYSILYSQAHKVADENAKADINFQFYDDRDGILWGLSSLYHRCPSLLPNNLKLQLFKYNGAELKKHAEQPHDIDDKPEVQGRGIIDEFYRENLKLMARCCGLHPECPSLMGYNEHGISGAFYGDVVTKFRNERKLSKENSYLELKYEIECLEKHPTYNNADWDAFMHSLQVFDSHTRSEPSTKIIADTIRMLRLLQEKNIQHNQYFNHERSNGLHQYIENYGQPFNYLKSSVRTVTNSIYSLFNASSLLSQAAYQVAEQLKPFLQTDDLEFKHSRVQHA